MYKCLKKNIFSDSDGYQLVPIRLEDAEPIRHWRNDQKDMLRQTAVIGPEEQKQYFESVVIPLFHESHPKQILFSFLLHNELIGYGGLTHIDWLSRRAELSFLMNTERANDISIYSQDFIHFLDLINQVTFNELQFHRLYTETFSYRTTHMQLLESCGFKKEGILRQHIYKKGKWFDSIMHGLLENEFTKRSYAK